jgi:RNA polymerase sigma-70 factor (ECF subfamily)
VSSDDRRLIAECLRGDSSAFGVLVQRYQDRLYNVAFRLVGNAEDAEDAVQEAFLHAYRALPRFKGGAQFFTWLYRIAVNGAISTRRKRRLLARTASRSASQPQREPLETGDQAHPGHALEQHEQGRRVHEALGQLSPEHRAVLVLKDMEGHKYEAMATILGVPVGTIRSRLHRARLEFRAILAKQARDQ